MTIVFVLEGEEFVALNGGPVFTFSPAISLAVNCETQEEIDELSEKLSKGGEILECSWVRDKFGISWQIWPTTVLAMLQDKDHVRSERVMNAVLQMKKLDIRALEHAYQQE